MSSWIRAYTSSFRELSVRPTLLCNLLVCWLDAAGTRALEPNRCVEKHRVVFPIVSHRESREDCAVKRNAWNGVFVLHLRSNKWDENSALPVRVAWTDARPHVPCL